MKWTIIISVRTRENFNHKYMMYIKKKEKRKSDRFINVNFTKRTSLVYEPGKFFSLG